jgi:excinuclease ABC subunit C
MVRQIDRVEAVSCDSEHEAAWLERNLLERQIPRWNRTAGGQEVEVWIRLDASARSPGISVVHAGDRQQAGPGTRYFGPYLGGARVRLATAGLHRIFPLGYAADCVTGAARDLAEQRGVGGQDRSALVRSIAAVLDRDPEAVDALRSRLVSKRAAAVRAEAFELAGRVQAELAAVDWVTCPQRAATGDQSDAEIAGWADGLLVRFKVAGGRMCGWRQYSCTAAQAQRWLAATPPSWREFADRNALLAARLAAGPANVASGPVWPTRSH